MKQRKAAKQRAVKSWKEFFCRESRFFETENGILYCQDCLKVLAKIPDESVDFVFTSPPYNLGVDYDCWDDSMSYEEYLEWCRKWGKEIYRILKKDGRFALNHYLSCGSRKFRFAPLMDLNWIFQEIGFKHHGLAVWWDTTLSKRTAWGSWLSASAPYVNLPLEGVLILYKEKWKKRESGKTTIDRDTFIQATGGIWKVVPERNRDHPAPFPEKLVEYAVRLLTFEENLVLDPFMGSGTTAVVCERLNRRWIGIEISPSYCELARERIEEDKK